MNNPTFWGVVGTLASQPRQRRVTLRCATWLRGDLVTETLQIDSG